MQMFHHSWLLIFEYHCKEWWIIGFLILCLAATPKQNFCRSVLLILAFIIILPHLRHLRSKLLDSKGLRSYQIKATFKWVILDLMAYSLTEKSRIDFSVNSCTFWNPLLLSLLLFCTDQILSGQEILFAFISSIHVEPNLCGLACLWLLFFFFLFPSKNQ